MTYQRKTAYELNWPVTYSAEPNSVQYLWSYENPLEPPPLSVKLNPRVLTINGMKWQARSDCQYQCDYYKLMDDIIRYNGYNYIQRKKFPLENEINVYRNLIQQDLWFFVYFVMKNPLANHPFIVQACREIQETRDDTLQVWARDHLKTSIISVGRTCQKILNDPERRIGIFSAVRPLAVKIQNQIKSLFETEFLIKSFPDILFAEPWKEADKWTEAPEGGLIVKRKGSYHEPTVSSWGLIEGMPTGDHYTDMIFDDIVTNDHQTLDIIQKIKDNFEMAGNIGTRDCQTTVIGTFYRHDDPLVHIMEKSDPATGERMFRTVRKTATVDGSFRGASVFLPEKSLAKKRAGKIYFFFCQQLLDPTPRGQEKLNKDHLRIVTKAKLPERLYKFMLVDGSGDAGRRHDRPADAWAIGVVGVEPYRDAEGTNNIYILDLKIAEMDLVQAQAAVVKMYCRNGRILKLGIEKVGMSTTEIHIAGALRARNRHVSVDQGNLQILSPAKRSKEYRIESALSWPLKNGKIHILDTVDRLSRDRLAMEMEKFPAWHDDGLDMLSYVYDIIKTYRFGANPNDVSKEKEDRWDRAYRREAEKAGSGRKWLEV